MDVVATLPPSDGQATAEVGYEHADKRVDHEVVGDASMSCIMSCEHYLMLLQSVSDFITQPSRTYPEKPKETGRCQVPFISQGRNEGSKDQ